MELFHKILDYIEENLPGLYAPISAAALPVDKDGISITLGPSKYSERYFDGSVYDRMLLNMRAKSKDSAKALGALTDIAYLLEKCPKKAITCGNGIYFARCEIYANPSFVTMGKNQTYVYACLVNAYYYRGN